MLDALIFSPVKAAFITEFNPLKSLPDTEHVKERMSNIFVVYFGSYWNETAERANVVIPIASLLGCQGTITNGERKIRRVNRVVEDGLELWRILVKLSKLYKNELDYKNEKEKSCHHWWHRCIGVVIHEES